MTHSSVTYQELSDLEADFDDFNVELLRFQAQRETALYARRAALVRRIQGFWPLVFEQAPPEVDQYIQPTDAAVLLSALQSIDVSRFEAEKGDPRSVAIKFTFAENEYFEDTVLEKRFWYRQQAPSADELATIAAKNEKAKAKRAKSGKAARDDEDDEETPENWAGLVSEPVPIKWKDGKDLTNGLLDLAVKVWQDVVSGKDGKDGKDSKTANQAALEAQLEKTAVGGVSFFNWFGYVGRRVTAEESVAATAQDNKARAARAVKWAEKADKFASAADAMEEDVEEDEDDDEDDEDDEDEDDEDYAFEIFADGDTVALGLAEDLWPNAIKYFCEFSSSDDCCADEDCDDKDCGH